MTYFRADDIWKAYTEPKCKFFSWLVMHDSVLTVDNMSRKNWPCNPLCSLCYYIQETTPHLLTQCNYTEADWNRISAQFNLPNYTSMIAQGGPQQWLQFIRRTGSSKEKRIKLGIVLTFWWQIWKERNRRIF
jgi:hypothetical protein